MRLTATHISHRFAGQPDAVLTDVDLSVEAGTMVAITGPSGSGKSTLLSVLGLVLQPNAGTVAWAGLEMRGRLTHRRARRELFGWITQTSRVFTARSLLDNAAVGLLGQGLDHRTARHLAEPALAEVGLAHRADDPARILSGGEAQRLTLARVMVAAKPVVLADEPTGQLDRANTQRVVQALRACAHRGAAVVVATHDGLVAAACDREVRVCDGRVTCAT